jgi:hypothetical protein
VYSDKATDWKVWGSNRSRIKKFLSSPRSPDRLYGPPNHLFNGHQCSFPGVKPPGYDDYHSSSSSAEIKNGWSVQCEVRLFTETFHTNIVHKCTHHINIFRLFVNFIELNKENFMQIPRRHKISTLVDVLISLFSKSGESPILFISFVIP